MRCENTAINPTEEEKPQTRHRHSSTVSQEVHHNKRQTYNLSVTPARGSVRHLRGIPVEQKSCPGQPLQDGSRVPRSLPAAAPEGRGGNTSPGRLLRAGPAYMETTATKDLRLLHELVSELVVICFFNYYVELNCVQMFVYKCVRSTPHKSDV